MGKKRTIENRIEEYRLAHRADPALDELLADCEAELYKLGRENALLARRLGAQATLPEVKP